LKRKGEEDKPSEPEAKKKGGGRRQNDKTVKSKNGKQQRRKDSPGQVRDDCSTEKVEKSRPTQKTKN